MTTSSISPLFNQLAASMSAAGISDEAIAAVQQNFVTDPTTQTSGDIFAQTLSANSQFFDEMSTAMAVIASGEDAPVEIGGLTINNVNTLAGMTAFTTQLNLVQAQMELINNLFNFVKQFEKSLGSMSSGSG